MPHPWDIENARTIIDDFKTMRGGLLPALHALSNRFGFVDDSAIPALAAAFNMTDADVYGVLTFYHDFKRTQPGRHTIKVCRGEACQAMGSEQMRMWAASPPTVSFRWIRCFAWAIAPCPPPSNWIKN